MMTWQNFKLNRDSIEIEGAWSDPRYASLYLTNKLHVLNYA